MMRLEMEELVRRGQTDELAVLEGRDPGVSDEEFEQEFRMTIAKSLLAGAAVPGEGAAEM